MKLVDVCACLLTPVVVCHDDNIRINLISKRACGLFLNFRNESGRKSRKLPQDLHSFFSQGFFVPTQSLRSCAAHISNSSDVLSFANITQIVNISLSDQNKPVCGNETPSCHFPQVSYYLFRCYNRFNLSTSWIDVWKKRTVAIWQKDQWRN